MAVFYFEILIRSLAATAGTVFLRRFSFDKIGNVKGNGFQLTTTVEGFQADAETGHTVYYQEQYDGNPLH